MWNRLVPYPCVVVKNWEGYLGCRVPPEEQGIPAPHQAPQARVPVPGSEVFTNFGCENQQRRWLSEMRVAGVPGVSLKGPVHGLTCQELTHS